MTRHDASQKRRKLLEIEGGSADRVTLPACFRVKWRVSSVVVTVNAATDKKTIVASLIMAFIDTKAQI